MHRTSLLITLCVAAPSLAQTKVATVAAPTRLDWAFAVRGFGKDAGKVPAAYDSTKQKYQLYVPPAYKAKEAWPLIVFISPGNEPSGWSNLKKVCEREGVFFCSPYAAGNAVAPGQRARIILDSVDDVRRQFRIDPNQTYIGGFSGGGRMSCALAFSLPEVFAGAMPVCGTNPLTPPTYLRHRLQDRASVAFITGETDFNRKENEVYMHPWFEELSIRSRLWVVPKLGHGIPSEGVMAEVYAWLKEDLPRRRKDAQLRPLLVLKPDETPDAKEQAKRLVAAAEMELKHNDRIWFGVTLLQGAAQRWPNTDAGKSIRARLQDIQKDETLLEVISEQGSRDEVRSLSAQAKAFERFGQIDAAMAAWDILAKTYAGTPLAEKANQELKRLGKK
jgi:pimeloyl-ACP methyl ester carboxylesterase